MKYLTVKSNLFGPINRYYSDCESDLCDIHPDDDNAHAYREPRNRTIDNLSDFEAVQYTLSSEGQLHQILRCFKIQPF